MVLFAPKVVVPLLTVKLLNVVNTELGIVLEAVNSTVPNPGVQVAAPCPTDNEPVRKMPPVVIVIIPGLSLPAVDCVKMTLAASKVAPETKVISPRLLVLVLPLPPTVNVPDTVSFGLPLAEKVRIPAVLAEFPPSCKLLHTAFDMSTVTVTLAARVTLSLAKGTPLGLQLSPSPQLLVAAPPSHVFCPKTPATNPIFATSVITQIHTGLRSRSTVGNQCLPVKNRGACVAWGPFDGFTLDRIVVLNCGGFTGMGAGDKRKPGSDGRNCHAAGGMRSRNRALYTDWNHKIRIGVAPPGGQHSWAPERRCKRSEFGERARGPGADAPGCGRIAGWNDYSRDDKHLLRRRFLGCAGCVGTRIKRISVPAAPASRAQGCCIAIHPGCCGPGRSVCMKKNGN